MERSLIKELINKINKKVLIRGWMQNLRLLGKINFLFIKDRSEQVQIVLEDKTELDKIKILQPGSVLEIQGTVKHTDQTKLAVEIINPEITILNKVTEPMPIDLTKSELNAHIDTVLDYRPLTLRHPKYQAIFKIQSVMVQAYREYLLSQDFVEFFGPNIISASSEGGTELFKVQYFDEEALLSQSAQLYKQMMVGVYERVFALMKCFRAEKSNTRRHLTEATQYEMEMGFISDFTEIMDVLEGVVKFIINKINEKCSLELEVLNTDLVKAPENVTFPRIDFKDALELYFKRTGIDERNEIDLSPGAEKELCKYAKEKFGTDFIFVQYFLREKTAFYAKPSEKDTKYTNYFDLLCGEAELTSGGQRIDNYDELVESIKLKGLDPENFTDYLSIFKYGMPKHGGFGMGMERFTMLALRLDNIREAVLFPSDTKRIASVKIVQKVFTGNDVKEEIIKRLKKLNIEFKQLHHEPTLTSEDSARVRGTKLSQGVKAIIFKGKKNGENFLVNVPSDQKVEIDVIEDLVDQKVELEKPEIIKQKFGLDVGSIPPFGNLLGLETYFKKDIENEEYCAFNYGSLTDSILMKSKDLIKIVDPIIY